MTCTFTLWGDPVAKARPRVLKTGRTYTPKRTADHEARIAAAGRLAMGDDAPFVGPVSLAVEAVFAVPNSWPKRRRADALAGLTLPSGRPDVDNVAKAVSDALNGIAYVDDSQICDLRATKRYGETPCVHVTVAQYHGNGF